MLLCHLSEAVAAPLSRGDSPKHGDRAPWLQRDPIFQHAARDLATAVEAFTINGASDSSYVVYFKAAACGALSVVRKRQEQM